MAAIIIGIDPGSRQTGYGVIEWLGDRSHYITSGCLRVAQYPAVERLRHIFLGLNEVVTHFKPSLAAIEQVFIHQNPSSALKLGQARGAAMVALGIPIAEYSAKQVKLSVVGYGAAEKTQIQHMVKLLLNLQKSLQADEADALAVALCHAHNMKVQPNLLPKTKGISWRKLVVK